jgi:hypothetical protein
MEPAPKPFQRRKRCKNCKQLFPPTKPNRVFCKTECKNIYNRFGPGYDAIWKKLTRNNRRAIEEATFDHLKVLRRELTELGLRMERLEKSHAQTGS